MKLKIHVVSDYAQYLLNTRGDTTDLPIILSRDPIFNLEGSTKRYVDNVISGLSSNSFTSGTLSANNLPSFTGSVTKAQGSTVLSLTSTGIGAGTYTKASVNGEGRLTGGSSLVEGDIPSLSWNKLDQNSLPTTLSGYGILDGVTPSGGNLTGKLKVDMPGTHIHSVLNKSYVDNLISIISSGIPVGTIRMVATDDNIDGYLRCNGALVSKSEYADLFNSIGRSANSTEFTLPEIEKDGAFNFFIKY